MANSSAEKVLDDFDKTKEFSHWRDGMKKADAAAPSSLREPSVNTLRVLSARFPYRSWKIETARSGFRAASFFDMGNFINSRDCTAQGGGGKGTIGGLL